MGMTHEEAIKRLYELQFYCAVEADSGENGCGIWQDDIDALDMAIAALREKEERSKGCEHCRSEINRGLMLAHGYSCCTDCGRRLEEV